MVLAQTKQSFSIKFAEEKYPFHKWVADSEKNESAWII